MSASAGGCLRLLARPVSLNRPTRRSLGHIDFPAVDQHPGIADRHHQLALDDALDVDLVGDQLGIGSDFAVELHLAGAECPAATGQAQPGQVEADQLPHRVEPEAAGHDRVAEEMAAEEPEVRADIEFSADLCRGRGRLRR